MDERPSRVGAADTGLVSRRTVNLGAAWSVPVVLAAVAAPAAQGSQTPVDRSASFGTVTGEKGEAVGPNREVYFTFTFTGVTGTNTIQITQIDLGNPWVTVPTDTKSFTADPGSTTASVVFTLQRADDNSVFTPTLTYLLNGVQNSVKVTVKNKVRN